MEFFQFHPTGIVGIGILLSEAARGEGGILRNDSGERFMERYAPTLLDLAPRDMVSRAIVHGDSRGPRHRRQGLRPPGPDPPGQEGHRREAARHHRVRPRLPGHRADHPAGARSSRRRTTRWAASRPTSRRASSIDEKNTVLPGLYAAGECACVSVHGANRLGTNSLVDILVFGRRAGRSMTAGPRRGLASCPTCRPTRMSRCAPRSSACARDRGARTRSKIRIELADLMMDKCGVFRTAADAQAS